MPKRILDLMEVPTLTRENVASHLQKYRLYLKKMKAKMAETATGAEEGGGAMHGGGAVHMQQNQHDRLGGVMMMPTPGAQAGIGGVSTFAAGVGAAGMQNPGMYAGVPGVGMQVDMHPMYNVPVRFPQGLPGDGEAPGALGLDDAWLQNPARGAGRTQQELGQEGAAAGEGQQPKSDSDLLRGYLEAD